MYEYEYQDQATSLELELELPSFLRLYPLPSITNPPCV